MERKLNINKFIGIHSDDAGSTDLPIGALSQLQNFQVLPSYKLRKRSGYSPMLVESFDSPIRSQWYGKLAGKMFHVVVAGGGVFTIDKKDKIHIGNIEDLKTNIFQFDNTIYFQNGEEYYKFTGEEIVDENEINFNSLEENNTYPKTLTLPAGKYEFDLGGGQGEDYDAYNKGKYYRTIPGGKGGKINFRFVLDDESEVRIEKIKNGSETRRTSFWIYINNTLFAAVGGGGDSTSWHHYSLDSEHTSEIGGAGGHPNGGDGDRAPVGGKGGTQTDGGDGGTYGTETPKNNGEKGYAYNHATKKGQGGQSGVGNGGCGYCGGGSGTFTYPAWGVRRGAGGGGSSFIIENEDVILLENSSGTNTGTGYAKITTVRPYGFLQKVDGHIPTVYKSGKPDGTNATLYEPINALTGKRKQTFNGDDTSTKYKLAESNNTSIDKVLVGGVEKVATTDYTVNPSNDEITFIVKPPTGINNVEVQYTHSNDIDRTEVTKYTNSRVYGGKNDNRVFLYGSGNRLIYSDLADGIPSAEYFPVTNTMDVGTTQHDITGLSVQYDRMLIHKERGTWWTSYDYSENLLMANFPTYPLNDNIGQSYKGVEQICENNPYVLQDRQLWEFVASNVRDERNVRLLSENVQTLLDEIDFSSVTTLDYEKYGEYWIINGRRIYIYSYRAGVWFYYYLAHEVTSAIVVDEKIALATTTGELFLMDGALDDDGELINAFAETGWLDYGLSYTRKFLNFMWVQIFPESDTSGEIHFQVDRGAPRLIKRISYKNIDFEDVDFADFTFLTNYNPKSMRLKPKAKKFVYIKFTIINNERNKLTLLGLSAPALVGGLSK